jgi:predicted Fe-Mo cluster-binding NifX family protein
MRIAIATEHDFVAPYFGCCPLCLIADVDHGRIVHSLVIPNPGCNHEFWAELFVRNAVTHVIAGQMGTQARSTLLGRGISVLTGVRGDIDEVLGRLDRGELVSSPPESGESCCGAHA